MEMCKCNSNFQKKKKERKDPANYRPISLTFVLRKIMERLVRNTLVEHLVENNLFAAEQHGFITGKSCKL